MFHPRKTEGQRAPRTDLTTTSAAVAELLPAAGARSRLADVRARAAAQMAQPFERVARATLAACHPDGSRSHDTRVQWWIDFFGDLPIGEITPEDVAAGFELIVAKRKLRPLRMKQPDGSMGMVYVQTDERIAPGTANRYLSSVGMVFEDAKREGLLPLSAVSPSRTITRLTPDPGRCIEIDLQALLRLIACARIGRNPALPAFVAVAATTGLRLGNLQRLVWGRIDLVERFIDVGDLVDAQGQAMDGDNRTKTGTRHRCILRPWVARELQALRAMQARTGGREPLPGEFVFGPMQFKRSLRTALRMAKLPEHWTAHYLRHACASIMAQSGATIEQVMQTTGHMSRAMAQRYIHLNRKTREDVSARAFDRQRGEPLTRAQYAKARRAALAARDDAIDAAIVADLADALPA